MIIENEQLFNNIIKRMKDKEIYKDIIQQFHFKILNNISMVNECIFYNPKNLKEEDINWKSALENLKDYTGIETWHNDIRLGDYFELDNIEQIELAYIIVDELATYLKNKYPTRVFVIVAQVNMNNEDNILLRFYQKRKNEEWIDIDNLDVYNEKLLIKIC